MKQNPLMYAIIGDIVGSRYERAYFKTRKVKVSPEDLQDLMREDCTFTDDTVLTIAVAAAILECPENPDFAKHIRIWIKRYPNAGYGGRLRKWVVGQADNNSFGNGAYMRISPIYWAYNQYWKKAMMAKSISCTHDHACSYLFIDYVLEPSGDFPTPLESQRKLVSGEISIEDYHNHYHFDSTCQGSVPEAIFVARNAETYEDCIKNAILLGGDTDTQAAIAGGIYGRLNQPEIPENLYNWALEKLPKDIKKVLDDFKSFVETNGF